MDCGTHLIAPILEPLRRVPGRRVFALRLCRENPGRHVLGEVAGLGNLLHYLASTITPAGLPCPVLLERLFSAPRSEEHTSELQSLMRLSYAVFCLKKTRDSNSRKETNN